MWHTDSLMLPISTACIPSDRVELRKWKCLLLSTDTKISGVCQDNGYCRVHANVMMGRHPMHMAAVPPHAHTQPHAHQVVYAIAAPKPHNVMLQQPCTSG